MSEGFKMFGREKIKQVILDKNGKMRHWVLKKSWYEKNNLMKIYESIFSETAFLTNDVKL